MRHLLFFLSLCFLLLSEESKAVITYRTGTEVLPKNTQAVQLQLNSFSKKSTYDESGTELLLSDGDSFTENDKLLKYSRGIYSNIETSFLINFRSVKSESQISNAANSGFESIGLEGKMQYYKSKKINSAFGLHFKKMMFTNTKYSISNPPPSDKVALGDDGLEIGADLFLTYYDKYFNYDFKMGFNKPSSSLSSELLFNAEGIYRLKDLFLFSGIGGIYSLKNDSFSDSPNQKPIISSGNGRRYNSINREKKFLYLGAHYAIDNFIIGLKGETIFSGRSTDRGETISFYLRWEMNDKNIVQNKEEISEDSIDYFAEGFVEKVSTSGNMIKINIGSDKKLALGTNIDVFNIDNYSLKRPIASGTVIEISSKTCIVKITKRLSKTPIQIAFLVRAH